MTDTGAAGPGPGSERELLRANGRLSNQLRCFRLASVALDVVSQADSAQCAVGQEKRRTG